MKAQSSVDAEWRYNQPSFNANSVCTRGDDLAVGWGERYLMAAIREFVAANRYILWLLLGVAIFNFLQLTVFYRQTLRCAACFLWRSRRLPEVIDRLNSQDTPNGFSRAWKRYHRWSRRNYRKPWMWIASMLQAIAMLAVAIAGLVLL